LAGFASRCPDTLEMTWRAQTRGACGSNADCEVGTCNVAIGRCQTRTELDVGWTGITHDGDLNDDVVVLTDLSCANPDGDPRLWRMRDHGRPIPRPATVAARTATACYATSLSPPTPTNCGRRRLQLLPRTAATALVRQRSVVHPQ
jgi:hypothetical protein